MAQQRLQRKVAALKEEAASELAKIEEMGARSLLWKLAT